MTNEEAMSYWKGGDPSEVLKFTNPYDYEGCIVGVSTDGRAVYELFKVLDFAYEKSKDNYDLSQFEDEEDMKYNIMINAGDMLSHDLSLHNPNEKTPVIFRSDEPLDDSEFFIDDSPYGWFEDCVLGSDFRVDRYIYSLAKMVNKLVDYQGMSKEEAVSYVYSLKKAGTFEHGIYNYVIVDDLYEHIPLHEPTYQENNVSYSPDFEKNCIELSGKDFLLAIKNLNRILKATKFPRDITTHIQIKQSADDVSKILLNASDGKIISRVTLTPLNKPTDTKPFYLHLTFVDFLISKISDSDTIKLFEGKNCLFVKINDEIYSTNFKTIEYPTWKKAIPVNQPYKAEFCTNDLKAFLNSIENEVSDQIIEMSFEKGLLSLKIEDTEKSIPCTYNCDDGFHTKLNRYYVELLADMYKEKIVLEMKDSTSAILINMENIITAVMPMK